MPKASISDSISAPRAAPKPRSLQYATMCTCGIDMATQQATPATHSSACSAAGEKPSGRSDTEAATGAPEACGGTSDAGVMDRAADGGRGRSTNASGSIATRQKMPTPVYVCRQPTLSMKCWRIGGHTAPAA